MTDMVSLIQIIRFYGSPLLKAFRVTLFLLLLVFTYYQTASYAFPKFALFLLLLLLMVEVFYHYKIGRMMPKQTVSIDGVNFHECATRDVLMAVLSPSTKDMLMMLLAKKQVMTLLSKMGIEKEEVQVFEIQKDVLFQKAILLARSTQGMYVTTIDIVSAYLLLSEVSSSLLFKKELKEKDVLAILSWVRKDMPEEELQKKTRVTFFGQGFADSLITGWTPTTKLYTTDWSYSHLVKKAYGIGIEKEYQELLAALVKKENNNVLLVGDPGIGKENLLLLLAQDSFAGKLGDGLSQKRLLELMTGSLLAGADDQAALEERLNAIIAEISHAGDVFLYIPELQHILGSSDFNSNLSGALLPYLKNGSLPIIATTTLANYKTYVENNPLKEVFTPIMLEQVGNEIALSMLFEKSQEIEVQYRCLVSYKALLSCIAYASVFLPDDAMPGSAVTLLSESTNAALLERGRGTIVTAKDVEAQVEKKAKMPVGMPKKEEKTLLLHLEDELHKDVIGQNEAVSLIAQAMRRVRGGMAEKNKPISFLFLGPTGVGKTETAKALARIYYHGEAHIIRLDMSEFSDEEGRTRLLGSANGGEGQGAVIEKVHDHPYSLVLLDEFEKAHTSILDLFLQVLADGRLTDNKGKTVSFVNTIIIATSNAGSEFIRETVAKDKVLDKTFAKKLLNNLQEDHIFRPELLNRFDEVVTFLPLGKEEVVLVVKLMLDSVVKTMAEQDIALSFDAILIEKIATDGYDPEFGARPLRRYIQDNVEDVLAKMKLEDKLVRGGKVKLSVDKDQNISVAQT